MRLRLVLLTLFVFASIGWSQTDNEEFRSTWVITWEHISGSSTVEQNQARIRAIMDNHVDANMNAVLWQVRQSGTAYYNSSYEPWGYYAGGSNPGYDPLAYAIEQAHARGLELHAWFNTFQAASTVPGTPAAEHPEWVCRDQSNIPMDSYRALSPGLADVREYLVDVAMEVVNNYDIDGLHLDYVRWNEYSNSGFNRITPDPVKEISALDQLPDETMIEALLDPQSGRYLYDVEHTYNSGVPAGYPNWEEFWRSSVTTFVETLHDSIQSQNHGSDSQWQPWVNTIGAVGMVIMLFIKMPPSGLTRAISSNCPPCTTTGQHLQDFMICWWGAVRIAGLTISNRELVLAGFIQWDLVPIYWPATMSGRVTLPLSTPAGQYPGLTVSNSSLTGPGRTISIGPLPVVPFLVRRPRSVIWVFT